MERILRQQAQSQQRNLTDAERQLLRNELSTDKIRGEIGAYETELHDLAAEWRSALRISRRPPDDMSVIPLPGLGGYYWPDTMAQAARKYRCKILTYLVVGQRVFCRDSTRCTGLPGNSR